MKTKDVALSAVALVSLCMLALPALAADDLVIVGTGNGVPVLKALGDAFTREHPGVSVVIPESIGSIGGIRAVGNDDYLIGRISRDLNDREIDYGLRQMVYATIPIVFFVNNSVTLTDITPAQACRIYDGTIRNWETLGGGTGKIRVILRENSDSSLLVLQAALPGFRAISLTPRSKTILTDGATLEECAIQANAIAFGSWPDVRNQPGVHALSLGGILPSNPDYPCMGRLSIVYKEKFCQGNLKAFVSFISSDAAKHAVLAAGALPVE